MVEAATGADTDEDMINYDATELGDEVPEHRRAGFIGFHRYGGGNENRGREFCGSV